MSLTPDKIQSNSLMVSISGIRGIIPSGLNFDSILSYSLSFAKTLNPKKVVIGRDSRPSGLYIENILSGLFLSLGINVIRVGLAPTPTLKAIVNSTKSDGGIMISASHNPIEWNAFKLVGKNGFFFNQAQINSVKENLLSHGLLPSHLPNSKETNDPESYSQLHIDSVLKRVNVNKIRKKKFKVFIEAVNGAGSIIVPRLLESLGCKVQKMYCEPDGKFPRPPEPTPKALVKTSKAMKASGADIGFALDPDADRLVVLTPKRGVISEEYTVPLSISSVIDRSKGKIAVINLSSSMVTGDILSAHGKKLIRSKVGEANVVQMMIEEKAFFGGEGNGGVIDPLINSFGRDSLAGIAHILNYVAESGISIDQALNETPEIFMDKYSVSISGKDINLLFKKLSETYNNASVDSRDGFRFDFGDSWVHVRASNTEPIMRVIAEARTLDDLNSLMKKTVHIIEG